MATTTISLTGWTYISNQNKTANYSGESNPKTDFKIYTATRTEESWAQWSNSSYGKCFATVLRFQRPNALKYSRITSATLTFSFDGLMDSNHRTVNWYALASYTTDAALSDINWNSFKSSGVIGEWTIGGSSTNYVNTPSSNTVSITALFNGDLSRTTFDIIVGLGMNSGYDSSWLTPSGCYLTVTYETATQPAPTPLYPKDQTLIESDSTMFSWQFNSETAAIQTAVQLEYKNVNDADYTVLSLVQSGYSYTLNQALPAGSYQWRIKATNDAGTTSGYSDIAYFNIIGQPAVPVINDPENKTLTEITWNTVDQQSFEIILKDQSGNELFHETRATSETSYKPNAFLNGQYLVSVRVLNNSLMWSDWAQKGFTISAAGPSAATISLVTEAGIPAVRIGYTLPADTNAVLIRKLGTEEKILAQLDPLESKYVDDTVSAGTVYRYVIRTYVNGYTDTSELQAHADFEGAIFQTDEGYLNLKASDEKFLSHSEEISAPYALNEYSGRSYYVIERGETIENKVSRRFHVAKNQKAMLDKFSLVESVFFRDNKEHAYRAAILKTAYESYMDDGYIATISLVRLNEEEVQINV